MGTIWHILSTFTHRRYLYPHFHINYARFLMSIHFISFTYSVINSFPTKLYFSLGATGLYESNQCTYLSLFFHNLGPSNRASLEWLVRYTPHTKRIISRATLSSVTRAQTELFLQVVKIICVDVHGCFRPIQRWTIRPTP